MIGRTALCALLIAFMNINSALAQWQRGKSQQEIWNQNWGSIVRVEVTSPRQPSGGNSVQAKSAVGTGFIISSDGLIVTAKHLLSGYINQATTPVKVKLGSLDGREVEATPWPFDIGLDVALLVLPNPVGVGLEAYQVAPRGDAHSIGIGAQLYVLGFRLGSNNSITPASLSSTFGGGPEGNLLWEITAQGVIFGNSGAPVFDSFGRVVGVVKGGVAGTGIGHIYPEFFLESYTGRANWKREKIIDTSQGRIVEAIPSPVDDSGIKLDPGVVNQDSLQIDSAGPIFAPPNISGKSIDSCINSPQFSESAGLQCDRSAQRQVANAFCRVAGFEDAKDDFQTRYTGELLSSFKYHEYNEGDKLLGRWAQESTGGAVFANITCTN